MPLLALSMLFPKFGIEPNSHYAIGTANCNYLIKCTFRNFPLSITATGRICQTTLDAVWICTTQQLTKLSPQANFAIRVSHSLFAHYWLKFYSNLYYSGENASSIPPRIKIKKLFLNNVSIALIMGNMINHIIAYVIISCNVTLSFFIFQPLSNISYIFFLYS